MGLTDDPEIVLDSPNSADAEVTAFLAENNISRQSSPYTWWKVHEEQYPLVASLARKFPLPRWDLLLVSESSK